VIFRVNGGQSVTKTLRVFRRVQADGTFVVAAEATVTSRVIRYNRDGSLDSQPKTARL
jgi:hypothetical protein